MGDIKDTSDKFFKLANSNEFTMACMDVMDNKPPLQNDPLRTIGDRMNFLESLEKYGLSVISTEDLRHLTTDNNILHERDKNLVKALRDLKKVAQLVVDKAKEKENWDMYQEVSLKYLIFEELEKVLNTND